MKERQRTVAKLGTVSRNVAENVRALREWRKWSLREVSERTAAAGHRIPLTALSKLELGQRAVSADDLAALAVVFGEPMASLAGDPAKRAAGEIANAGDRLVQLLRYIDEDRERLEETADAGFAQVRQLVAGDPAKVAMLRDYFTATFPDQTKWITGIIERIEGGGE